MCNFNYRNVKKTLTILTFLSLILCVVSCNKDDHKKNDFYGSDYRIGLWISPNKKDTLDFKDNTNLIRKGDFYTYEKYIYRIEGEKLFIGLPNSSQETQHPILKVDNNSVILGNMYISTGFTNNSGTFIKETKK